jgi:hypothetical protein
VYGGTDKFQSDTALARLSSILRVSTETTAAGLGANHQTGWTGLVAKMIELYGRFDPKQLLQEGKRGAHAGGKAEK